jgi:hypothetical protein
MAHRAGDLAGTFEYGEKLRISKVGFARRDEGGVGKHFSRIVGQPPQVAAVRPHGKQLDSEVKPIFLPSGEDTGSV